MTGVVRGALASVLMVLLVAAGCVTDMSREDIAAEYHNLGNGFYELKTYDKAIRYYELALERNPDVGLTRWNLALAYYHSRKYTEARTILEEWLALDPDAIEARETLALVYRGLGEPERALQVLDEVLVRAPENTRALNNRAIILWELGRQAEAAETLLTYLEYEPSNPAALYNLTLLRDEQGLGAAATESAENYLAVAAGVETEKEHVRAARYVLARTQTREEAYYRALEIYAEIVEEDESQGDAWFGRASILLTAVEDPSRGYEALVKALDAGYRDGAGLAALLAREDLLDRDRVEALLRERERYPGDEQIEAARKAAESDLAPQVVSPMGPWAEPGVDAPPFQARSPQDAAPAETGEAP